MRFDRLDLNLLVVFDRLMEYRSVTATARALNLSQSALSGALRRLREYFGDELLVQIGRTMVPTHRAAELVVPVRNALMLVRSTITRPAEFDPGTSERRFTIIASDFVQLVLLGPLMRALAEGAPGVSFDILSPSTLTFDLFERGEVDVFITVDSYMSAAHPSRQLFQDEAVVVCWNRNSLIGDHLTEKLFYSIGHVATSFAPLRRESFYEEALRNSGIERRIEVRVPEFSMAPNAVVGTNRVTVMHRRHAEYFASFMPLRLLAAPVPLPHVHEMAQWHGMQESDAGVQWLLARLTAQGALQPALTTPRASKRSKKKRR